jgi:hypothetical protein
MKFCRHCGTVLPAPQAPGLSPSPMMGGMGGGMGGMAPMGPPPGPPPAMPGPGPMGGMGGGGMGGMQPMGGPMQAGGGMGGMPPMSQPRGGGMGMPGPGNMGGAMPPMGGPPGGGIVAGSIGSPASGPAALPSACPRCGSSTSPGFAFCQQCGMKLNVDAHAGTLAVTGPGNAPAPMGAPMGGMGAPMGGAMGGMGGMPPMAAPARAAAALAPTPAAGGWGAAVSVNRDGTDGERFALSGEFVVIGRVAASGADIAFEQDRFLARQHARLEPTTDGSARVVPIDTLNGVYRKIDGPVELSDGMIVLAGREVMRYETVEAEEKSPTPLIRHGVALFGSPPREPWGRLTQLLPSGGVRDVRHLWDDEIVIGREDGELVFSDDQFLSRRHASIAWDGARATLSDLGSSNGTFVRLAGPTSIKHGDHLRMGDQLFRIELRR